MIQILQLVFYFIIIFFIPYLGLILVNTVILIYTLPAEQLLPQAIQNTNLQIQKWLKSFNVFPKEPDCYSDF
ncbi:hypothetical protein ACFKJ3_04240, partial [Streptococcus agalactiae]